ncbi:MAG: dTDP-4-dehydrorhamnose reductase [Thermodesulfobacteriota bacterium]
MKILLFGCNGQVGWELQRSLAPLGKLFALDCQGGDGLVGDFTNIDGIVSTVRSVCPDVIVNAAAHTAVDRAESEPELAAKLNAEAPAALAEQASKTGAWLVHYSTDYVFDGSGDHAWIEKDLPAPLNVYGRTKLEGETAVEKSGCRFLIFRTSWVYAVGGTNFIHSILRLAHQRDRLDVIDDQVGAPTGAELLADVAAHAVRAAVRAPDLAGIYHLTAAGETTWYDYARRIVEYAREKGLPLRVSPESVEPVSAAAFSTAAVRPKNSRLDTGKIAAAFDLCLPPWEDGVLRVLDTILTTPHLLPPSHPKPQTPNPKPLTFNL